MMKNHVFYRVFPMVLLTLYITISRAFQTTTTTHRIRDHRAVSLAAGSGNENNGLWSDTVESIATFWEDDESNENAPTASISMPTLTEATTWTMRMNLENLRTEKGKLSEGIYVIKAKFVEEEGYEPPQGFLQQVFLEDKITDENESVNEANDVSLPSTSQMTIRSGRWTLSEDPNDRKDSLWIWGLFKEPLYPFLLLQFEVEEIILPGKEDSIKPFTLFAQINHKRGENGEVILSSVTDLTIREKEMMKADPFGAAKVELYESVVVGKLQLQPQCEKY